MVYGLSTLKDLCAELQVGGGGGWQVGGWLVWWWWVIEVDERGWMWIRSVNGGLGWDALSSRWVEFLPGEARVLLKL